MIHGARGATAEALRWLELSYERGHNVLGYWENTRELDAVRDEPGFQDLMARIRADHERMRRTVLEAEAERPVTD